MAPRTVLSGLVFAAFLLAGSGHFPLEHGAVTAQRAGAVAPRTRPASGLLSRPTDRAFYQFSGHPVIRPWSSIPRRT